MKIQLRRGDKINHKNSTLFNQFDTWGDLVEYANLSPLMFGDKSVYLSKTDIDIGLAVWLEHKGFFALSKEEVPLKSLDKGQEFSIGGEDVYLKLNSDYARVMPWRDVDSVFTACIGGLSVGTADWMQGTRLVIPEPTQ